MDKSTILKICNDHEISDAAMFAAQCSVESGNFTKVRESLNYAADKLVGLFGPDRIRAEQAWRYGRVDAAVRARTNRTEPDQRADQKAIANLVYGGNWGAENLGNTMAGDGWLFIGRGFIQITGRENYRACSRWMYGDDRLLDKPELLEQQEPALESAAWYFTSRGLHRLKDIVVITRKINGGLTNLSERKTEYQKWRKLLAA